MAETDYAETAKRFHGNLDERQFNSSVEGGHFFLVEEEPMDLPSLVTRRLLVLQLGYILARTVVLRPAAGPLLAECYQPLSAIGYEEIAHITAQTASFDVEQRNQVVRFSFAEFWANERLRRYFYPWTPPDFASLKCPRLVFDGETLTRLALLAELKEHVETTKTQISFDGPIIGLHAGPGDEKTTSPDASLDALLAEIHAIGQESGCRRVLIAGSEAGDAIQPLRSAGFQTLQPPPQKDERLAAVTELELLSACDWIVGRVSAHAPRIAAARIGQRTFRCDRHRLVSVHAERRGLGRLLARSH